jgi:hypothetical protein
MFEDSNKENRNSLSRMTTEIHKVVIFESEKYDLNLKFVYLEEIKDNLSSPFHKM